MLLQWLNRRRAGISAPPENGSEAVAAEPVPNSLRQAGQAKAGHSNVALTSCPEHLVEQLLSKGDQYAARGDHASAIIAYQELIAQDPLHATALYRLGAALCNLSRFKEAENYIRRAVSAQPELPEALNLFGFVLRALGRFAQAEVPIRRAMQFDPTQVGFKFNLGYTLLMLGRAHEAEVCFAEILELLPSDANALACLGDVAGLQGRFEEAETYYRRALAVNQNMPCALASVASLRRMTVADSDWLTAAQELAASRLVPVEEAALRFAIGKYWDDVGDFERAFQSYRHANETLKATAAKYDWRNHARFVDDMIRVYTRDTLGQIDDIGSTSTLPVFVVGMPRSGTSLVEQIIASHPSAKGAGELGFWTEVLFEHVVAIRQSVLPASTRKRLADEYLRVLAERAADVLRVVDKAPVNSEYLGLIHSVFPNARMIYMQRDPIDSCLSCYFQNFSSALSYTMDLSDLAHYYRQHHRLMTHWRAVLPPGNVLDVPYEELVSDPENWIRKIVNFVGLEWHEQCLEFHQTKRTVTTASSWQVRQRVYRSSVERWRNYEPFIGPLLDLRDLVA